MASIPQITRKPLKSLVFDPGNPRLPRSVNGSNEGEVINWMLDNENVLELMASIAEKGFYPAEPLLVAEKKRHPNVFEVIEGNRRLTAVKLLLKPELATSRKSAIKEIIEEAKELKNIANLPVIVFDSADEIQTYLGYRHITGVQPWDSLAKARYLKRMQESLKIRDLEKLYRSLAKMIGSRADHVKLLLAGLAVYETIEENSFFGIKNLNEKSIKFGVLYTAINKSNIAAFIGIDLDNKNPTELVRKKQLGELTKWMFEENNDGFTRLGESRDLRLLDKVVSNDNALKAFRNGKSLRDSVLLTDEPQEIFQTSISDSLYKLQTARDYMHLIDNPLPKDEENVLEITKLSRTISATLKAKSLEEKDEEN